MKKVDLTQGKVMSVLMALALPIMGSSLLQFTYNLIDMLWIGHLGSGAVASIGSASFFTNLGYAANALVVIGTGIKTAQHVGKEDMEGVREYIHAGMVLTIWMALGYGLLLIVFGSQLIAFLGLKEQQVARGAYYYLAWSAPILFFAFFNNVFSRIFTSLGNSKSALKISSIGIVLNIILDPLFIYGFKWGIVGAAVATLAANAVMTALYFYVGRSYLTFSIHKKADRQKFGEIIRLGTPIAMQRILFTMINIMLAKVIAVFGAEAVAAQKIGVQIESVTYMVTGGLNGAVASFIGQNDGARRYDRLEKGYRTAMGIGIVYAGLSSMIFWLFGEQLAGLFVRETGTIAIAASYLRIIAFSQIFNAAEMVSNGYFTGIAKPKIPSAVSIIFTALRLPMALAAIRYLGVNGIWWSITLSTVLKGSVLVGIYLLYGGRRMTVQASYNEGDGE